jgi:sulfur-oxidizing protein SoxX
MRNILTLWLLIAWTPVHADDVISKGAGIAADPNQGNCLSCHFVPGGEMTGTVAPPLLQMKLRFPDRQVLRAQIWDATERNTESVMPPYGRHAILTEQEIDWILEYVYSL